MTLPKWLYPMKAVTVSEDRLEELWENPYWIAEQKFDGARYLAYKHDGIVEISSRNPAKHGGGEPVYKQDNVPHLVETLMALPDGTVLDGEMITHRFCQSNEVTSIMGSKPERALKLQEERGWMKYALYDIIFFNGKDLSDYNYLTRRKVLEKVFQQFLSHDTNFILAPVFSKDKEKMYERIVEEGGEGVILKHIKSKYEWTTNGKKLKAPKDTWVKVKKYDTYDVVVMGYTEPTMEYTGKEIETWQYWYKNGEFYYRQNEHYLTLLEKGFKPVTKPFYNGWIGAIRFGQYKDGELVEIGQTSGLDDKTQHAISMNKEAYIGTVIEVGAMRQNKDTGALVHPRFIRFRDDKSPEECILFGEKGK